LRIPTIGIGAGPDCDGQVLVFHDLVGLSYLPPAKFVRSYANLRETLHQALVNFRVEVGEGSYPGDQESYHWTTAMRQEFEKETTRSA
jgi:3-methyl-2-oxobutanoate hydroxymethyltransferase